jgi:hypothetical protein
LPGKEIHPADHSHERIKSELKPTVLALLQITTKERCYEDNAKDLLE